MRSIDLNSGRHLEIKSLLHYHLFLLIHIKHGIRDKIFSSTLKSLAVSHPIPSVCCLIPCAERYCHLKLSFAILIMAKAPDS